MSDSAHRYGHQELTREQVDRMAGAVLLVFGTDWCGHCAALQARLAGLLEAYPQVKVFQVEDGPRRPLGRSFRVKLWPNLVFLRDGQLRKQLARPDDVEDIRAGLEAIMHEGP